MKGSRTKYSSGFDPKLVPGCTLWLDAADSSTLTLSGSNVTQWRDKANGVVMTTQGTLANLTRTQTGINGRPSVFLNNAASDSVYMSGTLSNQLTGTAFYVIKAYSQRTVDWRPFVTWFNSAQFPAYGYLGSTTVDTVGPYTTYASPNGTPTQVLTPGSTYLISYGWTGTTTTVTTNGSTVQTGSQQPYSSSTTTLWLGADGPSAEVRITLDYGEVLFFDRVVSTAERQQLEGYLAWKWGTRTPSIAFPATHPYATVPPTLRPFGPMDVSGCSLWLDAADRTALTLSGSNVTQWRDKSGNERNVSTSSFYPTYASNQLNGLSTLQFSNSWLQGSYPFATQTTLLLVYTTARTTGQGRLLDVNGNAYGNFGAPWQDSQVNVDALLWLGGSNYPAQSIYTTLTPQTGPRIYAAVYNGTSSQLYRNGVLQAIAGSGFTGPADGTTITLGAARWGVAGDSFVGSLAELILFNGILTTTQRQQVEGYLARKWGLQSSIAVGHPYRFGLPSLTAEVTPRAIPGCALWLDAADRSTLTLSGSNVTAWADKSGSSNHMTISPFNATNPTYSATTGVSFNNSALHTNTGIQTMCAFAVYAQSDTGAIVSGTTSGAGTSRIYFGVWLGNYNLYNVPTAGGTNTINNNTSFSSSALFVGSYIFDGSNVTAFANGTSTSNTAFSGTPGTSTNVILGGDVFNGSISRKVFSIRELILYTTATPPYERRQIEGYLAWKWGLQGNLPFSHTFRMLKP